METTSGNLASALKIEPGITAIIGSGGKSTLLKALGLELMRAGGRVLLCTTTHMFPVAGVPWDGSSRRLDAAPWKPGALHVPGCTCEACAGMSRGSICQAGVLDPETGKLSAPAEPPNELAQRFDYVLAEADGSKRLPLKAHAPWEPVIPSGTANIVWIVGIRQARRRGCPPPRALLRALRLRAHRYRHARARRPGAQCRDAGAETQYRTRHAQPSRHAQRPHDGRPLRGSPRPPRRRHQPQIAGAAPEDL